MRKLIVVLSLVVGTVAFAPRAVTAQEADCSRDYVQCLNDSYDLEGIFQTMADLECAAEYAGCVARKIAAE